MKIKQYLTKTMFLLIFFLVQTSIFAQTRTSFPRFEPDPKALEFFNLSQRGSGYSWTELAEISLWASGDTNLSSFRNIRSAVETLLNLPDLPASGSERAEFILNYMHKNILRSYSLYQTRVDTIFSNGRFNCVSSAVLYTILCNSAGLRTSGVVTRDHAFTIVHIGSNDIDVETTNQHGFDPGNRKDFHDQFGNVTGFAYVPAQNYRDRQTINQLELISLIMTNRIADLERSGKYAEAVPIAADRAALLTGNAMNGFPVSQSSARIFTDPRNDLLDRLLNYGASLLRSNREEDCLRWAVAASSLYPDKNRWDELILAAVNNNMTKLIRANRFVEARNFLEAQKSFIPQTDYAQFDSNLIDGELLGRANRINSADEGNSVIDTISQALTNGRMAEKRANELIIFSIQKTASVLSAAPARNWRAAALFIEDAITRFGSNRELENALNIYKGNIVTDYHNLFAAEWNKRNYDEAERILNEALEEFPDNRQLLSNKETINRHRAR